MIPLVGTGRGVSMDLLWEETGEHIENPLVRHSDHKPCRLSTPEVELEPHW